MFGAAGVKRANEVYSFWFGEMEKGIPDKIQAKRWFMGDSEWDEAIRQRFESLLQKAGRGECGDWLASARDCLSLIILLDQFPRNIYRGSAKAFSFDGLARDVVARGMKLGLDSDLWPLEKGFFYMPLEHSEKLEDQQLCVSLFEKMLVDVSGEYHEQVESSLQWTREHCEIIEQFGRFPHRNKVLGRQSTEEEVLYLTDGGKRFGQ